MSTARGTKGLLSYYQGQKASASRRAGTPYSVLRSVLCIRHFLEQPDMGLALAWNIRVLVRTCTKCYEQVSWRTVLHSKIPLLRDTPSTTRETLVGRAHSRTSDALINLGPRWRMAIGQGHEKGYFLSAQGCVGEEVTMQLCSRNNGRIWWRAPCCRTGGTSIGGKLARLCAV